MIVNFIDRQQATQEGNTISIKKARPWGSTACMAIGVGLIGMTALLSGRKNDGPERIYIPKDHELGQHDSSIRGELQQSTPAPAIAIQNIESSKSNVAPSHKPG
jgi:hypothetical protein